MRVRVFFVDRLDLIYAPHEPEMMRLSGDDVAYCFLAPLAMFGHRFVICTVLLRPLLTGYVTLE